MTAAKQTHCGRWDGTSIKHSPGMQPTLEWLGFSPQHPIWSPEPTKVQSQEEVLSIIGWGPKLKGKKIHKPKDKVGGFCALFQSWETGKFKVSALPWKGDLLFSTLAGTSVILLWCPLTSQSRVRGVTHFLGSGAGSRMQWTWTR